MGHSSTCYYYYPKQLVRFQNSPITGRVEEGTRPAVRLCCETARAQGLNLPLSTMASIQLVVSGATDGGAVQSVTKENGPSRGIFSAHEANSPISSAQQRANVQELSSSALLMRPAA